MDWQARFSRSLETKARMKASQSFSKVFYSAATSLSAILIYQPSEKVTPCPLLILLRVTNMQLVLLYSGSKNCPHVCTFFTKSNIPKYLLALAPNYECMKYSTNPRLSISPVVNGFG